MIYEVSVDLGEGITGQMMSSIRNHILLQLSHPMLAQANMAPQTKTLLLFRSGVFVILAARSPDLPGSLDTHRLAQAFALRTFSSLFSGKLRDFHK